MADEITLKALQDASVDAKSLEEVVNGNDTKQVTTRLGESYPSVKKAIKTLFENGGLPAEPFATKALMMASALADGDYAMVTDDTVNNGLYIKTAGSWVKSDYDPLGNALDYVDSNALFKPSLIMSPINLNTLINSGFYTNTAQSYATTALNYPKANLTGSLKVLAAGNLVLQDFTTLSGDIYSRYYSGTTWSSWSEYLSSNRLAPLLADYPLKTQSLIFEAALTASDNLDDLKTIGMRMTSTLLANWSELNYPVRSLGVLQVFRSHTSTIVFQRYITTIATYTRLLTGTTWSAWSVLKSPSLTDSAYDVKEVIAAQDLNSYKSLGLYIKNSPSTGTPELNYPTRAIGLLKVYKGSMTSVIFQEFVATDGYIYFRYWNNVVWSEWVSNSPLAAGGGGGGGASGIAFDKTATKLTFFTNGTNGKNSIRYELARQTTPEIQQDSWGIISCAEVDDTFTLVKPITSGGVWEAAIAAADNASDHSGGGHGDELLQSGYFMIDGVHYPMDFVSAGSASEIKYYQKSTLYIEDTQIVLCYREMVWTFTQDGLNLKQKITFPATKVLNTAWISMLPVLRKTNQNNTGDRVTDTEVRSSDGVIIDASEPSFPLRRLPVADGDSISLSSATSGISAEVIINEINASPTNQAMVQNTAPYNKIYISGIDITTPYTTEAGEVWSNDTTFKINTRN